MLDGLADGLLSRLLVAVPPVTEVMTDAVSSKGSAATAVLEEPEEDEDESKAAANVPCLSEGEEFGEDADEDEDEEEEGEEVEARTGVTSSWSKCAVTSVSSFALVEAGLGLRLRLGGGVGVDAAGNATVSRSGCLHSREALSAGSSTPHSVCSSTSP